MWTANTATDRGRHFSSSAGSFSARYAAGLRTRSASLTVYESRRVGFVSTVEWSLSTRGLSSRKDVTTQLSNLREQRRKNDTGYEVTRRRRLTAKKACGGALNCAPSCLRSPPRSHRRRRTSQSCHIVRRQPASQPACAKNADERRERIHPGGNGERAKESNRSRSRVPGCEYLTKVDKFDKYFNNNNFWLN